MFIYLIVLSLVAGLISNIASALVKIQVNQRVPVSERFSWLDGYTGALGRKHRELFPGNPLRNVARYSFWICLILLTAIMFSAIK